MKRFLSCFLLTILVSLTGCDSEEEKKPSIGTIYFVPIPSTRKVDLRTSSSARIFAVSDVEYGGDRYQKYYYSIDGSDPTESSIYTTAWDSKYYAPKFSVDEFMPTVKVLVVYEASSGEKVTKRGEVHYNIGYYRISDNGTVSFPVPIRTGAGFYGSERFTSPSFDSDYDYYYETQNTGTLKYNIDCDTDFGEAAIYKNGVKITVDPLSGELAVAPGDLIHIEARQGSINYQASGDTRQTFQYELRLE
jgi:hypothetical protein